MRETIEFRVPDSLADRFLPAHAGVRLGIVRKLELSPEDALFAEIGRIDRELRADGRAFFTAWIPHRRYSRRELASAEMLKVSAKKVFEPAGEECGTVYDDTQACPVCGIGAPQLSPLFLDSRSIPQTVDVARTIAGEIIVSRRIVQLFRRQGLRGAEFAPVCLADKNGTSSEEWAQLTVSGPPVESHTSTRFGNDPFDRGGGSRCPQGHVAGLSVLSEVWIRTKSYDGTDLVETKERVGVRRGLLRPQPLVLVSPSAWRAIEGARLKGFAVEVAYLSDEGGR